MSSISCSVSVGSVATMGGAQSLLDSLLLPGDPADVLEDFIADAFVDEDDAEDRASKWTGINGTQVPQATASKQPAITVGPHGGAAITGDGVSRNLLASSGVAFLDGRADFDVFIIAKKNGSATGAQPYWQMADTGKTFGANAAVSGKSYASIFTAPANAVEHSVTTLMDIWRVYHMEFDLAEAVDEVAAYFDQARTQFDTQPLTGNHTGTFGTGALALLSNTGDSAFANLSLARIAFTKPQSGAALAAKMAHLGTAYNVP